jgi:signal peptidase I
MTPDDITPTLVKRIVAVGGDTLAMRGGHLIVNGRAEPSSFADAPSNTFADQPQQIFAWQHRIEASSAQVGAPVRQPSLHEWGPLVVPAGTYFMMGDNRDNPSIAVSMVPCRAEICGAALRSCTTHLIRKKAASTFVR